MADTTWHPTAGWVAALLSIVVAPFLIPVPIVPVTRASADALAPTTSGWSGTITVSRSYVFAQSRGDNAVYDSESTTVTYTNLAPDIWTGAQFDSWSRLQADVDLRGRIRWWGAGLCALTWNYAYQGPSSESRIDEIEQIGYGTDGPALSVWEDSSGSTYLVPMAFGMAAYAEYDDPGCNSPNPQRGGSDVVEYDGRFWDTHPDPPSENLRPLVDDDPDPERLSGTTTFSLASFPYLDGPSIDNSNYGYDSYEYVVRYDLTRELTGVLENDLDGDGVMDDDDNCVDAHNPSQADVDVDGTGDVCDVTAVAAWEMKPLIEDQNGDGLIDTLYKGGNRTSDVPEDGRYPVILDACGSVGARAFSWRLGSEPPITADGCRIETTALEGLSTASLTVVGRGGVSDSATIPINPRNLLIVSLGDSFASGEGVPRTYSRRAADVLWDDKSCHRSAHAGPARAALSLESRDTATSVTLIHLACSGATLTKGLLAPYPDPPGKGRQAPQVSEAIALLNGQRPDAVTVSLGGNDIGFSNVIGTCARYARCPGERRRSVLELTKKWLGNVTLHEDTQRKLKAVPGRYRRLNACLTGDGACKVTGAADTPLGVDSSDVFITEYPSLAKDQKGRYCNGALRPPLPSGIADEEFAWADKVVLLGKPGQRFRLDTNLARDVVFKVTEYGLNQQVARTALLGWRPVTGIYTGSAQHGYCSTSNWVVQFDESIGRQGDKYGTMHPNVPGHQNYARALVSSLAGHLG